MHYKRRNFMDAEYLCKLGKENLNTLDAMQVFSLFCKLVTYHTSFCGLPLTIAELATVENGPFFGPPCILCIAFVVVKVYGIRYKVLVDFNGAVGGNLYPHVPSKAFVRPMHLFRCAVVTYRTKILRPISHPVDRYIVIIP